MLASDFNANESLLVPDLTPGISTYGVSERSGSVSNPLLRFRKLTPYTKYRLLVPIDVNNNTSGSVRYINVTPFAIHAESFGKGFSSVYRRYFSGATSKSGLTYTNLRISKPTWFKASSYSPFSHPYSFLLSDEHGEIVISRLSYSFNYISIWNILRYHYNQTSPVKLTNTELRNTMIQNRYQRTASVTPRLEDIQFILVKESDLDAASLNPTGADGANTNGNYVTCGTPIVNNGVIRPNVCPTSAPPQVAVCGGPIASNREIVTTAYDFIQTFYVNKDRVEKSSNIDLTQITLYVKKKPSADPTKNNSGLTSPGINISICECDGNLPVVKNKISVSEVHVPWNKIINSNDANQPTIFKFDNPVRVSTGKYYGIMIDIEDDGYELWISKRGWALIDTNDPSPGSSKDHSGELFLRSNLSQYNITAESSSLISGTTSKLVSSDDLDLKFDVECAEYSVDDVTAVYVNEDLEFFTMPDMDDIFATEETVYRNVGNVSGQTVSIEEGSITLTGTNTQFTNTALIAVGDTIVVVASNTDTQSSFASVIKDIISDTEIYLETGAPDDYTNANFQYTIVADVVSHNPDTNNLVLDGSSANSSVQFQAGDTLTGCFTGYSANITSVDAFDVSVLRTSLHANVPTSFKIAANYNLAYDNSGTYTISSNDDTLSLVQPNYITGYEGKILSKSLELNSAHNSTLYQQDANAITNSGTEKSSEFSLLFDYVGTDNTLFECPAINVKSPHVVASYWEINNDETDEHTNNGNAASKHISTRMTFGDDKTAEDIKVDVSAYRPIGTDVKIYVKVLNSSDSDDFNEKNWSPLEFTKNEDVFSSSKNFGDIKSFSYGFPIHPPVESTLTGSIDTSGHTDSGNVDILGTETNFGGDLQEGDLVKIYDPLAPNDDYVIRMVTNVASNTSISINENISNTSSNVQAASLKIQKLTTPHTAFSCEENYNIVRYFSENGGYYDGYNTVSVKTVLLSTNNAVTPFVDDYKVIGLSS
jgi:hypothetical protein